MPQYKNIQELFLTASAIWANRIAFRHINSGQVREIRYRELPKLTYQSAQALWQRGVRAGDYIGICAHNSPEWVLATIGAFRIGAKIIAIDTDCGANQVLSIIDKRAPKLILLGEKQYVRLNSQISATATDLLNKLFEPSKLRDMPDFQASCREDAALTIFSSERPCSTNEITLTHGDILANAIALAGTFDLSIEDRLLSVLPLSCLLEFTGGLLAPILKGATIVYSQINNPSHLKNLLKFESISILLGKPTIFQTISEELESQLEQLPKSVQLRTVLLRRLVAQNHKLGKFVFRQLHNEIGGQIKFWLSYGKSTSLELVESLQSLGITFLTKCNLPETTQILSSDARTANESSKTGSSYTDKPIANFDPSNTNENLIQRQRNTHVWDEDGLLVCNLISQAMDSVIWKGICPSGSRIFSPEMNLSSELGLDSFSRLDLACRLEKQFSIKVSEIALQEAQTVEDVVVLVKCLNHILPQQEIVQEHAEQLAKSSLIKRKQWPINYYYPSSWPYSDSSLATYGRQIVDIGLNTFLKLYNQFETTGTDRLQLDPPYIVAANHSSQFDSMAILSSFPMHLIPIVHPVAAADHFFHDLPTSAISTYLLNAIPFDRFGAIEDSLKACEQILRKGHILIIFPEGKMESDGTIGSFRPGIARLSITVGCPIIPAYISGTSKILPKGSFLPKPEPLRISYGLPLYPPLTEPTLQACQSFTDKLRHSILELSGVLPNNLDLGSEKLAN